MSLWSSFLDNDDLRTTKLNHYFPIYERHFSRFVNLDVTVFEIGVFQGGSANLWKKYLGPNAKIVGIDIEERCSAAEQDQVTVRVGDASDPVFLNSLFEEFGVPDIVIDDGSHRMRHINASFDEIYPRLAKNSVYLIEDLHWCYWPESGVGEGPDASFLERAKSMIDLVHAHYTRGRIETTAFTQETAAIHIYDSVLVFEKGRTNRKVAVTGTRQIFGEPIVNADAEKYWNSFVNKNK